MRHHILTWFAVLISATTLGEATMPKKVHQNGFPVVGIEVRTTNAKEASGEGVIPKQWQRFFQDGIQQKIPDKVDGTIYALYTDYASDRNGEYSFVIGVKVNPKAKVPAGMILRKIPAGEYAVITSDKGPVGKVVTADWQQIWSLEDKHQLGGPRAYRADFEVYDQRAADPQSSQVDVYVGVK
ncbi:MAG: GyrI-like domain-containing protein [Terriglobales bacterium]